MNDRLALRIGALHLARFRRNARDAAWAAARLRLRDASLDRGDARYAHDAMVAFGHALRVERARRPHESGHELDRITDEWQTARPLPWRRIGLASAALLALALFLLTRAPSPPAGQAVGATPAGAAAVVPNASPLRGRSDLVIAVVVTPAPPRATASATPIVELEERVAGAAASGGPGSGPSGSGTGNGGGGGTGTLPPAPAPTPTASPTVMVLDVTVIDKRTQLGVPNVCVIYGSLTCAIAPHTDANGHAQLRLSIGQQWTLDFKADNYFPDTEQVFSQFASQSIVVPLMPTR